MISPAGSQENSKCRDDENLLLVQLTDVRQKYVQQATTFKEPVASLLCTAKINRGWKNFCRIAVGRVDLRADPASALDQKEIAKYGVL